MDDIPVSNASTPMMADHQYNEEIRSTPDYIPYTPPTPNSQFSSAYGGSPHAQYGYSAAPVHHDEHSARYSHLYPVNPEQGRAVTYDEEQNLYRENRSTIASTGLDSLTTVYDNDTGKETVQQPQAYPYKEVVSPPLQSGEYSSPDPNSQFYYGLPSPGNPPAYPQTYPLDEKIAPQGETMSQVPPPRQKKRFCGFLSLKAFIGVGMILSAIIIGLAIFFGIHFGMKKSAAPATTTTGAFPNSGFAAARTNGSTGNLQLYFQHSTGQIRRMERGSDGTWGGGDGSTVVASNARNGTPIAVINFETSPTSTSHLFYIADNGQITELVSTDGTTWKVGPLSALNLVSIPDSNAVMQACYGNYYGFASQAIPTVGIHLFYASAPNVLAEYNWNVNSTTWTQDTTYTANTKAGMACYSWGTGAEWYAMMVNLDNDVNLLYRDAYGVQNEGKFYNSTVEVSDVMANTSLGFTGGYLFAQSATGGLTGYNLGFDTKGDITPNTTNEKITISGSALPGTRFSVMQLPSTSTSSDGQLAVAYQASGNDVSVAAWNSGNGTWTITALPVPAS